MVSTILKGVEYFEVVILRVNEVLAIPKGGGGGGSPIKSACVWGGGGIQKHSDPPFHDRSLREEGMKNR